MDTVKSLEKLCQTTSSIFLSILADNIQISYQKVSYMILAIPYHLYLCLVHFSKRGKGREDDMHQSFWRSGFSTDGKSEMGMSLEGIERELAAKRQKDTQFKPGRHTERQTAVSLPVGTPNDQSTALGRIPDSRRYPQRGVSYEIAKRVGVSHATYERSKRME